jgi:hypothetical protein
MSNLAIARTILQQLGGRRFIAMTGARNICASSDGALTFRIPKSNGINYVSITLDPSDTYTVLFGYIGRTMMTAVATMSNVYAEDLQALFTEHTGLDTHL